MINLNLVSAQLRCTALVVWLILTLWGMHLYSGSPWLYLLFSGVYLALLIDGFTSKDSSGYLFFSIFLWLGFWAKLTAHLWLGYPYFEPVGYFDGSANAWDQVLIVSVVGALGILAGKLFLVRYYSFTSSNSTFASIYAPAWYSKFRLLLWLLAWFAIILFPILNLSLGTVQTGLASRLVLPWPFNALIAWILSFGLALMIYTLIFWDDSLKLGKSIGFVSVLAESFLSGISVLSRSTYLFHTFPYLLVFFVKTHLPRIVKLLILITWVGLFLLSIVSANMSRFSNISSVDITQNSQASIQNSSTVLSLTLAFKRISKLLVDRWTGLEGVMAITAYPDKKWELLKNAIQEKRTSWKMDIYTKEIAKTELPESPDNKFQYASIPGGTAFFYYSGSIFLVFIGMAGLVALIYFSEELVYKLLKNPYFKVFWGMSFAQMLASFGLWLSQLTMYLSVCFFAILVVYIIQSRSASAVTSNRA